MVSLDERLARILADDYLDGVGELNLDDIRAMRAECQGAETSVSYLRRMAQGRLDIVHTYLDRTGDGSETDLTTLVEELPDIIGSGPPRPPGPGRLPQHMAPDFDGIERTDELDAILDPTAIAGLPHMGADELGHIAEQLAQYEARISDQRRALHERIDRLQAEIVSRYKSGRATVDGLLG